MASKQEDVRDTTDQFVVDDHAPGAWLGSLGVSALCSARGGTCTTFSGGPPFPLYAAAEGRPGSYRGYNSRTAGACTTHNHLRRHLPRRRAQQRRQGDRPRPDTDAAEADRHGQEHPGVPALQGACPQVSDATQRQLRQSHAGCLLH